MRSRSELVVLSFAALSVVACTPAPAPQTTVEVPAATATPAASSPEELRPAMTIADVPSTATPRTPATTPPTPTARPTHQRRLDSDGDGLLDDEDLCPAIPEDRVGPMKSDGCPAAADRDADTVPDASDRCPDEAEDADGFQDGDGCPDFDNDADGVPDASDLCPTAAENMNGVRDADGCPEP